MIFALWMRSYHFIFLQCVLLMLLLFFFRKTAKMVIIVWQIALNSHDSVCGWLRFYYKCVFDLIAFILTSFCELVEKTYQPLCVFCLSWLVVASNWYYMYMKLNAISKRQTLITQAAQWKTRNFLRKWHKEVPLAEQALILWLLCWVLAMNTVQICYFYVFISRKIKQSQSTTFTCVPKNSMEIPRVTPIFK